MQATMLTVALGQTNLLQVSPLKPRYQRCAVASDPDDIAPVVSDSPRILIVDDEVEILAYLEEFLDELGYGTLTSASQKEALDSYDETVDLVLVDLHLGADSGIELVRELRQRDEDASIFMMTAAGTIDTAVEAMQAGARDYLTKPLDLDRLELVIAKALQDRQRDEELRLLRKQVNQGGSFQGLIGVSSEMQKVYKRVRQVTNSDATVLIQGETGTGKELVARAVHDMSGRSKGPFTAINCGALTESLLESELFGHEKGAFTGAVRQKQGFIERSQNGTLFLDEIEDMSPAVQVRLLRAIQEREIIRVGGTDPIKVDFRLVAATNVNLRQMTEDGAFRSDLFYRLSVIIMDLPPLRRRGGDIPLLAHHFLQIYAEKNRRPPPEITPETMMLLRSYAWPGNVRELENFVEQAILLCDGERITPDELPSNMETPVPGGGTSYADLPLREARDHFEKAYLEEVLDECDGRVTQAAERAGISRRHFYGKIQRYDLKADEADD
jgi:DNA-binding NtrC family response regulator